MFGAGFGGGTTTAFGGGGFNAFQPAQQQTQQTPGQGFTLSNNGTIGQQPAGGGGTGNPAFKPVPIQDSGSKTGGPVTVYLQSITAMNAYSTKSFEELRMEDYMKGNKAPGAKPGGAGLGFNAGATNPLGGGAQTGFTGIGGNTGFTLGGTGATNTAANPFANAGAAANPFAAPAATAPAFAPLGGTTTAGATGFNLTPAATAPAFTATTNTGAFNFNTKPAATTGLGMGLGTGLGATNAFAAAANTGGLSTNMFNTNANDKKTTGFNLTQPFSLAGATTTPAATTATGFNLGGGTNTTGTTGFNLSFPTTTAPATTTPAFNFSTTGTTNATNPAGTTGAFNFSLPSFTANTAGTGTTFSFQPAGTANFQFANQQQQQQQQQQLQQFGFPVQQQPPPPPQPIYSTAAIAQKLEFLVNKKEDFLGETAAAPQKKDGKAEGAGTEGAKSSTSEEGKNGASNAAGINFAASYTSSSSVGGGGSYITSASASFSSSSSSSRRIVPRGMRSKLMESNLLTIQDFQTTSQAQQFPSRLDNALVPVSTNSQALTVTPNPSLLPVTNHLRLPPVLDMVDDMQPPIQLSLPPAKTPEKKLNSPPSMNASSLALPHHHTGLTPYSFDTPVLSTRQLLKPDDLSMLGHSNGIGSEGRRPPLNRGVSIDDNATASAKKDQYSLDRHTANAPRFGDNAVNDENDGLEYQELYAKGYLTNPDLRHMTSDEMTEIYNFTVIRPNFGQIEWLEPVNIAGLNLADIINIKSKEVFVYEDIPSPPVGQGLNKPARVTLLNINPKAKNDAGFTSLLEKLKTFCRLNEAEFVSYEKEEGKWSFNVRHFSRYGFADDDDEEEDGSMKVENDVEGRPGSEEVNKNVSPPVGNIEKLKNLLILKKPVLVTSPEKTEREEEVAMVEGPLISSFPSISELLKVPSAASNNASLTLRGGIPSTESKLSRMHLSMMKSFRVGWSADGQIAVPCVLADGRVSVSIRKLDSAIYGSRAAQSTIVNGGTEEVEREFFKETVQFISTLPLQQPRSNEEQFAHLIQFLRDRINYYTTTSVVQLNDEFVFSVQLIHALFGQLDLTAVNPIPHYHSSSSNPTSVVPPESYQRRNQLIQQFLDQVVRHFSPSEEEIGGASSVLDYYLLTNQMEALTSQLMNQGMYRTALLACQLGSDASHLVLAQQQMLTWNTMEKSEVRNKQLFNLASGWSDESMAVFDKASHWIHVIVMVYNYFFQNEGQVDDVIDYYESLLGQGQSVPEPRRGEGNAGPISGLYRMMHFLTHQAQAGGAGEEGERQVLLREVLQNEGFTDDALDYSHTFVLVTLLELLHFLSPHSSLSHFIRQQYVFQLMQLGDWRLVFHVAHSFPQESRGRVMEVCLQQCPLETKLVLLRENFFLQHYQQPSTALIRTSEEYAHYTEVLFYSLFLATPLHNSKNQLFTSFHAHYLQEYVNSHANVISTRHSVKGSGGQLLTILQRGQEVFLFAMIRSFVTYFAENLSHLSPNSSSMSSSYFGKVVQFLKSFDPLMASSIVSEVVVMRSSENLWVRIYYLLQSYVSMLEVLGEMQRGKEVEVSRTIDLEQRCVALQSELMKLLYGSWSLLGQESEVQIMLRIILSHVLTILVTLNRNSEVNGGGIGGGWAKKVLFDQHMEVMAHTVPTVLLTEAMEHSTHYLLLSQASRL